MRTRGGDAVVVCSPYLFKDSFGDDAALLDFTNPV